MQFDPVAFNFANSLLVWLQTVAVFFSGYLLLSLFLLFCKNLLLTPQVFISGVKATFVELTSISLRRISALTLLTFREAVRRKALLVFVVFAFLFMFAGWFLTGTELRPSDEINAYTSFALKTIGWLTFPVVLLLACWGIPEDIRIRSIHTVTTKPVRRIEIVLGRMIGYSMIATLLVGIMGGFGLAWVNRQVSAAAAEELTCRRPIFGQLQFKDRDGGDADFGINVGDIWSFRSYIEGATKARAIWTFTDVTPSVLQNNGTLRIESRFQAFRSHKGQMDRPLMFQYVLLNQVTKQEHLLKLVRVNEFRNNVDYISATGVELITEEDIAQYQPKPADLKDMQVPNLFRDFVTRDGKLTIMVSCLDPGQYMGMARPDFFLRLPDQFYAVGFLKAVLAIEMFALLLVVLGVTFSTFLKGPIATLLTFVVIAVGYGGRSMLAQMEKEQVEGGGVLESIYRMAMHMNPTTELPVGPQFWVMEKIDLIGIWFVRLLNRILPDVNVFDLSGYVAKGFDVPWSTGLAGCVATVAAYLFPCLLIGYFSLRNRELEAK